MKIVKKCHETTLKKCINDVMQQWCNVTKMYETDANADQHLQNENLNEQKKQWCLSSFARQA